VPEGSRATDEKGGANFVARFLEDDVLTQVQLLKPLAAEAGISMAQLALAWILRNQNVASAIVGATRPEQLEDSLGALEVTLEDELVQQVDAILQPVMIDDPELTEKMTPRTRV
jgi:aryl-alcohol dehydrogenase-like predicted oxidoreductase